MFTSIPNLSLKALLHISGSGGGSRLPWSLSPPHSGSSSAVVAVTAVAGIVVFAAIFYSSKSCNFPRVWI
ncbi:hypothetical protein LINPERPRIM_LOCUS33355 [Linum perenne]